MEFKTVERCGRVHVVKNGVESTAFIHKCKGGGLAVLSPQIAYMPDTLEEALAFIAEQMDTWYTVAQAAERLAEMGAFDEPPSTQLVGGWCREGKFPGAFKLQGKGGRGSGGAWRIPGRALQALADERRKGQ